MILMLISVIVVYYDGHMEDIRTRNDTVRIFHKAVNEYIRRHRLDRRFGVSSIVEITSGINQGGNEYEY